MPRPHASFALGAFDVLEPVARGGMAEVWRAVHREQRIPAAIKVLTGASARVPAFVTRFANEARLVAGLDHPNVVSVFDVGVIPLEAELASKGRVVTASPYLAMEWASGGTLEASLPHDWPSLRACLASLLGALAHAHARGVLHLDIKPGNVLTSTDKDLRPGLKLADFGISRGEHSEEEEEDDEGTFSGTAAYAAPEQILGKREDRGPSTDLYSLGCLGYRLASGEPPFVGEPLAVITAHLSKPPPPLRPRFFVPEGFRAWLTTLLDKDPAHRFDCAADAAGALFRLSDGSRSVSFGRGESAPWSDPPEDRPSRALSPLFGAGLGLYGLRTVPLVGRSIERERLWSLLLRVDETATPTVVSLEGPSGCGKSRLASWLSERSVELGKATALRVTHTLEGTPADGLSGMLARHFRCVGVSDPRIARSRVAAVLRRLGVKSEEDVLSLAELVAPAPPAFSGPVVRFGSARERHEVIARHLALLSAQRPTVLSLDDVQWGSDALAFVQHLLDGGVRAKILVAMTVRSEALKETRMERELFEALAARPEVNRLPVGPLPPSEWAPLVSGILGLDGELALRVEARAAGNPLFAIQLVGDWVERGLLVPGRAGFELSGAMPELPADLDAVWRDRIERLLSDYTADEERALELAAALGQDVSAEEWRAACARCSVDASRSLVEDLLLLHLARTDEEGPEVAWSFVHGLLREAIERRARERGRFEANHRLLAATLLERGGPNASERVGRHLLAARDFEAAAAALLRGARERIASGEYRLAMALLTDNQEAMRRGSVPESDPRWCESWLDLSTVERKRGHFELSEHHASAAEVAARCFGFPFLRAGSLVALARIDLDRANPKRAFSRCEEAVSIYDRGPPGRDLAQALIRFANAGLYLKEWDRARAALERANAIEGLDDVTRADAAYVLTFLFVRRDEWASARIWAARANEAYERAGHRTGIAESLNALGEAARAVGDLDAATAAYQRSYEMAIAVGAGMTASAVQINLALTHLSNGRADLARPILEGAEPALERSRRMPLLTVVRAARLATASVLGDWPAWEGLYEGTLTLLKATGMHDPDVAACARMAGDAARDAGHRDRALRAYQLSLEHAEALLQKDAVEALSREIASISSR